jgi:hypothetical protein
MRQTDAQDGRLQLVQAAVDPVVDVQVALGLAVDAQQPHPLDQCGVRAGHGAAVAQRAQVLRRVEAERGGVPLAVSERLAGEIVSLPLFPELTDAEVERVATAAASAAAQQPA